MKKKISAGIAVLFLLLAMTGISQATLTTIGTAQFLGTGTEYNLIWDNDNNSSSVVWLDYTKTADNWVNQVIWASGLNMPGILTYNTPGYTVNWGTNWRLPSAGANPQAGHNQTTSEMGDLFYNDLELSPSPPFTSTAQLNATNFDNLIAAWYWSGTEYASLPDYAWFFGMINGSQNGNHKDNVEYCLAVRSGQVSAVPVPGAIWLLGSGLAGVFALHRRRKGNRV